MDGVKITMSMLFLLAGASRPVASHCNFTTELDTTQECIGLYECSETVGDLDGEIRSWACLSRSRYICDNRGCRSLSGHTNEYGLKIKVINATENTNDMHRKFGELGHDHVMMLTLTDGFITFIPSEVYSMTELLVIDVSHNKIATVDLAISMGLERLNVFNASFNLISELEAMPYQNNRIVSNLTVLDLSHNCIKFIPDYYFSKLYNLSHLNISYNNIYKLNLLTFEGLTRLETLSLSNNNIQEIGMTLARFSSLVRLALDHNDLSSIEENNFKMLSSLTELNLSFNNIIFIDDFSFQKMPHLTKLQLNDNDIKTISKSMFIANIAIQEVDFSDNQIRKIEPFSFKGKNITVCNFRKNALTSLDDNSIFAGIRAKELDLSTSNIKSLGKDLFVESQSVLERINLSKNSISFIHVNTFRALNYLSELDLSNNNLQKINFDMTDLVKLSSFNVEDNQIRKITKETFRHLTSLKKLNLSNNTIVELEKLSFNELERLQVLDLSNNDLPNVLVAHTFHGLPQTTQLNLMYSKITSMQEAVFTSMANLIYFNASFGDINDLEYNAFIGTNIWILDLSHNNLEIFSVNNTNFKYVVKIFLNDNRIGELTNLTFYGMDALQYINLNNNNVLRISIDNFRRLKGISVLQLSSNVDIMLEGSVFSNMSTLREVELQNVWKPFSFKNTVNTSIEILDLTSSNITDINSVMIYKLEKLQILLLNSNKIRQIDRYSFHNLSSLISLDLSNNMISIIKPGSFAGTYELSLLNLHNNNLTSLVYGVFDDLPHLQVLNLSSNAIHTFQATIFHNSHRLSVISLEDNLIDNIDFNELKAAAIPKIAIGGNLIKCDTLVASKQNQYYGIRVTSEKLNFHVENVDGISCKQAIKGNNPVYQHVENETETEPLKMAYGRDRSGLGSFSFQSLSNQLEVLQSAIYFQCSCILLIVFLLLGFTIFVYVRSRRKLVRTYSVSSRRHLTGNDMEMAL